MPSALHFPECQQLAWKCNNFLCLEDWRNHLIAVNLLNLTQGSRKKKNNGLWINYTIAVFKKINNVIILILTLNCKCVKPWVWRLWWHLHWQVLLFCNIKPLCIICFCSAFSDILYSYWCVVYIHVCLGDQQPLFLNLFLSKTSCPFHMPLLCSSHDADSLLPRIFVSPRN